MTSSDPNPPAEPDPSPSEPTKAPADPSPRSETTEPKPTEPKPTEPKPTEPKPTEPKPTEPKPTEPQPTESIEPSEPTPPVEAGPAPTPDPTPPVEAGPAPTPDPWAQPRAPLPDPTPTRSPSARLELEGFPPGTSRFVREGLTQALRAPFLRSLLRVPLKKVAIWGSFLGLLFLLRQFFGLIFMTFVITYITNTIVTRITPYFTSRKVPVLLVFAAILGAILGIGWMTVPRAIREGKTQLDIMKRVEDPKAYFQEKLAGLLKLKFPEPAAVAAIGSGAKVAVKVPIPRLPGQDAPPVKTEAKTDAKTDEAAKTDDQGETPSRVHDDTWLGTMSYYLTDPEVNKIVAENFAEFNADVVIPRLKQLVVGIWSAFVYLMLALLFSFLIMWDLPKLSAGIGDLEHSRLGDVWHQVAPSIATFFRLLGHAFEAQTVIALMNTALTAVGMLLLGIPGIGFLSIVVFMCSYIPILGMWISTFPICVMALQAPHGGLMLIALVVLMVSIVHAVEAYVLNPRIYGYHMKMHPLAILVVLYLGQHLVGMWGLIIGVPLATYIWRHLILGQEEHIFEPEVDPPPGEPPAAPAT